MLSLQLVSCDEDRLVWRAYLDQAEQAAVSAIRNRDRADAAATAASAASRGAVAGTVTANGGVGDGKGGFAEAHRLYALALQYCKTEVCVRLNCSTLCVFMRYLYMCMYVCIYVSCVCTLCVYLCMLYSKFTCLVY